MSTEMQDNALFEADKLTQIFKELKLLYSTESVPAQRREYILSYIRKYGYVPFSYQKAINELSTAEVLLGLEEKFIQNSVFKEGKFIFNKENISPVTRAGYRDSSWIKKEQLNIKLINLSALGDGNKDENIVGKFPDWLKQLLILPTGNLDFSVLGTVIYLSPFHPRDFGCAYIPKSKDISMSLEDTLLKETLGIGIKDQVKLFLLFSQLAGHPIMYDVLPQTGRFSKTVLANSFIARWFDIKKLNNALISALKNIANNLKCQYDNALVDKVTHIISNSLDGSCCETKPEFLWLKNEMESLLNQSRKKYTLEMLNKHNQDDCLQKVNEIIFCELNLSSDTTLKEELITDENHNNIVQKLIANGLWPSPGGAWCSSGYPIYDSMSQGGSYPLFKHYDIDGNDVTWMANLDCQTPFFFLDLQTNEYNKPVIDFWCDFLTEIQQEYNFDAFRFDHVDHIVDRVSQTPDGYPISYRTPYKVLSEAISKLRMNSSYFGTVAEYMLWDGYYKEYHQNMGFDLLWGDDIVSQFEKKVHKIIENNNTLEKYNESLDNQSFKLSIFKTYNNQDGEFREIDQYPGQMEEDGALFKWFKLKFLPNSPQAERPILYIDGDESFTCKGIEKVIGAEVSMKRNNNEDFFRKFDAINRFALFNTFCRYGISEIHHANIWGDGLIAWTIKKQSVFGDDERLFIVANENPPKEVVRILVDYNQFISVNKEYTPVKMARVTVPEGFNIVAEYILPDNELDFITTRNIDNLKDCILTYDNLQPASYHIYLIKRL